MKRKWSGTTGLATALAALALLCASASAALAAKVHPDAGSTSAAFLKIPAGARSAALAGAFTAVGDDPYSLFWNPAGLAWLKDRSLSFNHNEHFQGLDQELLVYTVEGEKLKFRKFPALRRGTWALGLNYFHTPKDLERRSGLYESDPLYPISSPEGTFRAYDLALALGYGWSRGADTNYGAAVKVIGQSIDDESGVTAAADLGVTRSFNWLGGRLFTAGASVNNIGPGLKLVSRSYPLPLTFRAGLSHQLPESGALVALELSRPVDNYPSLALGLEQQLTRLLALRAGYRYRQHGNELGGWSGFSAGMGLALERLRFDYAFSPFGELGNSHQFSLSFRFGGVKKPALRNPRSGSLAADALSEARLHSYRLKAKPLKISPTGVLYQLDGVCETSPVETLRLRAVSRGPAPDSMNMAEGRLPEKLAAQLPAGLRPCASLQVLSLPGNVQGDFEMVLRAKGDCAAGSGIELLYLTGAGWSRATVKKVLESEAGVVYSGRSPQSTHYVIGVKE